MCFEVSFINCCIKTTTSRKPTGWDYGAGNGVLLCNKFEKLCIALQVHRSQRHVTAVTKKRIETVFLILHEGFKKTTRI